MGFRFRRTVQILPGIRLNLSKSGVSTSLGVPGASINLSGRGTRSTVGLPGTGMSFSSFSPNGQPPPAANQQGDTALGCGIMVVAALVLAILVGQCSGGGNKGTPEPLAAASTEAGESAAYAPGETVYVDTARLNGRAGPDSSARVLGHVRAGQSFTVAERSGDWVRIAQAGVFMWVAARHLSGSPPAGRVDSLMSAATTPRRHRSRHAEPAGHAWGGKVCRRGKPCGNACIAVSRTCHK